MANRTITIDILGMSCAACSARVEKALNKKDGVLNATVNLLQQKATIEYDEQKVDISDIVDTIEKVGYQVPLVRKTLLIEGMSCTACSARVEKALNKVEG